MTTLSGGASTTAHSCKAPVRAPVLMRLELFSSQPSRPQVFYGPVFSRFESSSLQFLVSTNVQPKLGRSSSFYLA
jgi:hypothetical protein